MPEFDLQLIKEGGAMVFAALLLMYTAWKDKMYNKTLNNHLQHLQQALGEFTIAISKLSNATERNEKVIDRVERVLDK